MTVPTPLPVSSGPPLRTRAAAATARLVAAAARRTGRGGTVIGGHVALRLDRGILATLSRGRWVATVSATNGKTTTTRLLAEALASAGAVVSNAEGSNLRSGLAGALVRDLAAPIAALEVDEATLATTAVELRPAVLVLGNLSRDQLDRYGEVRILAERWRATLQELAAGTPPMHAAPDAVVPAGAPDAVVPAGAAHVVANADDPLVVWAAQPAPAITWVAAGQAWTGDSAVCPACRAPIRRAGRHWACTGCDLARPTPHYEVDHTTLRAPDGTAHEVRLAIPGSCNVANAALAAAAAVHAGVALPAALQAMAATSEVAGRYRQVDIDGHATRLLMAKNPAGWQQALEMVAGGDAPVVVGINARVADGHDPSWLWDVPFEVLAGRTVVATGDRALDLAVRLAYAGIEHSVVEGPVLTGVDTLPCGRVEVIANYTAFGDLLGTLP